MDPTTINLFLGRLDDIDEALRALARPRRFGNCRDCEFWREPPGRVDLSHEASRYCMRHSADSVHKVAQTAADSGCGEFEPRVTEDHAL